MPRFNRKPKSEFDEQIVDIARVARIVAGGRRFSFRVTIVIGDRKGRVGVGVAKGSDVAIAREKAIRQAKKNIVNVQTVNGTIYHETKAKYGSAKLFLKPAPEGTGIIAGGTVRTVVELAGIKNIVGKILGTQNKINNVKATINALANFSDPKDIAKRRGMTLEELQPGKAKKEKTAEKEDIADAKKATKSKKK
ncbi:MAG: 30S ribosomal protein S5 [bacterium]